MAKINVVLCGDSAEVLRSYPAAFFDSVVCDPPYGLSKEPDIAEVLTKWVAGEPYDHGHGGFMGKSWDSFVPHPDVWREVFRVLKPGGHALVFAGTRTQDLMTVSLRLGGFEIRDVIEWLYFSGFPKSMDVGKQFDKRRNDIDGLVTLTSYLREKLSASGKSRSEIDAHFGTKNVSQYWFSPHRNPQAPPLDYWSFLKGFLNLSDEMDILAYELNGEKLGGEAWAEREKVGEKTVIGEEGSAGGYQNGIASLRGVENVKRTIDITAPATDLARKWDGWGTALKPAHEPIIVARKPLAGTVAETVEKYGTGAININDCRIGRAEGDRTEYGVSGDEGNPQANTFGKRERVAYVPNEAGRFPANCITTDDDEAFYSPYFNVTPAELSKKAAKKDRNACADGSQSTVPNTHPTVKPIELMRWLITLVTPPGGTVLDPFAGSGTTPVAAAIDGFNYVAVDQAREHVDIANARLIGAKEAA